jgi:hypothetical protein
MRVKIAKYCQEIIDGHLIVLDVNKIIDIQESDAHRLIDKNLACECEMVGENKMMDIVYKKRGRPRKEV